ncbi:MAG: indolepyruvate oxidoreductase subunit beta [Fimbriimonadaceae bacterium]|nr:indolepyruvate oxidoreductase subunit beta [Fimbriimonadaceae bacterium]
MKRDIVVAGVGGQGILTIARGLSLAALGKGLNVKQAEVHGMSQRGGAVYANVRMSEVEIFSDIIAAGQANMILAVEPMEALRYGPYLRPDGVIISNTNAVTNIPNYPPIEEVLDAIARHPQHVLLDMERIGRTAGSPLSANVVAIGAASLFLDLSMAELEAVIESMFERKGERVVATNLKAFRFGRRAASAYLEAIDRGATSRSVRQWVESLDAEALEAEHLDVAAALDAEDRARLTGAEAFAFESILRGAYDEGRMQLFEHEVYRLIEIVGAITPPTHVFVPKGSLPTPESLAGITGEKVVLKLVSPDVVHKSDAQAVVFVPNVFETLRREMDRMIERHVGSADVAGVLVVEFVEGAHRGFGGELFVGIRATREFGAIIAAGLGGVETEFFAARMKPGQAVAKAVAAEVSAEEFLEEFKKTAAYDLLAGNVRGHERIVSDGELVRCFRAFISIARHFCTDRGEEGPDIGELEVNPFAFRNQHLVPLDGLARLRPATPAKPARPIEKVAKFLEPNSIALVGASATSENFGRIILKNIVKAGFNPERLTIIHEREEQIDGVRCVRSIRDLADTDLLVIASPNHTVPGVIEEASANGRVAAGIIISAGLGEAEGSAELGAEVAAAIRRSRESGAGAVYLGPNCMGVQSGPGRYDTFFIPEAKTGPRREGPAAPVAIISQSGAFVISRMSHLDHLNPAFLITLGNQADVTVSDLLTVVADRADISVVGIYLEGFADLDGEAFVQAARAAGEKGKAVVFYKGGRTDSGRQAAAGHTASLAGDYDVCLAAVAAAGALVANDFAEFEQLLELSTLLADKEPGEGRIFAVTNAGMEAVGLADSITQVTGTPLDLSERLDGRLRDILAEQGLDQLVSARNPLDLTPMARESAYEAVTLAALDEEQIDAVILSCVPLTPQLKTSAEEIAQGESLAQLVPQWARSSPKPLVFVLDAGPRYDALASAVREGGVPVFRTADSAGRCLARYMRSRMRKEAARIEPKTVVPV